MFMIIAYVFMIMAYDKLSSYMLNMISFVMKCRCSRNYYLMHNENDFAHILTC
jgi:hypothetical protein